MALVGRTNIDVRDTMVEGESGLLAVLPHDVVKTWNRSLAALELDLVNGCHIKGFSAQHPDRLRGPQHHRAWCDEVASWEYPETWDQLMLTMRLGERPQVVVTTTPRPTKLIRQLISAETTHLTRGSTYDNLANLAPTMRDQILARYEGTRLGRQELEAEVLEDVEGALWWYSMFEAEGFRVEEPDVGFSRVVVAVDPAVTAHEDSDETGIVVVARGRDGHGYVLADRTCKLSPDGWARRAVQAYEEFGADRVVAEVNQGFDLVESVMRSVAPGLSYKAVKAKQGKKLRAEPVAALYEQQRVHHVGPAGVFAKLEEQMTTWTPEDPDSPDRVDALVHGITELGLVSPGAAAARDWLESLHPPCPQCGMPNAADAQRCSKCGRGLGGTDDGKASEWSPWASPPTTLMPDQTRAALDLLRSLPPTRLR